MVTTRNGSNDKPQRLTASHIILTLQPTQRRRSHHPSHRESRQAVCVRGERARVGEEHDSDAGSTVSGGDPKGVAEANPA